MDKADIVLSAHGIVAFMWFAFGTLGIQFGNNAQALIGVVFGVAILVIGFGVRYKLNIGDDSTTPS